MRQDIAGLFGAAWIDSFVPFLDVLNDSVLIDHEGSAIAEPLIFPKDAVILHHCPFEIAEKREGNAVDFREFLVRRYAVDADAENLCIIRFEFSNISLICFYLFRSTTSKSQYVKGEHDVFLSLKVAKLVTHRLAISSDDRTWQGEIGSRITNF